MRTEHTLRYLLVRHLKQFDACASRERRLEVTHSLRVAAERDRYVVTWQAGGTPQEKVFPRTAFTFYRRGDTQPDSRNAEEDLRTENDAIAGRFAQEALGVTVTALHPPPSPREPYRWFRATGDVIAAAGIAALGGLPAVGVALLLVLWVERLPLGRLYASGLFIVLATVAPPLAAVLGAASYGLLQFLDPNHAQRSGRLVLCAMAALVGVARFLAAAHVAAPALGLSVVALIAVALAAARSLYDAHFRALPLALPFFCLGLYANGYAAAAIVGMGVTALDILAAAYGHRWEPIQRERTLTPNG